MPGPKRTRSKRPEPIGPIWRRHGTAAVRLMRWPARLAAAAIWVALAGAVFDSWFRDRLFADGRWTHHSATFGLLLAGSGALACAGGAVLGLSAAVERLARRAGPRLGWIAPGLIVGLALSVALYEPVVWVFKGRGAGEGALAKYGAAVVLSAVAVGGASLFWMARGAIRAAGRGRPGLAVAVAALLCGVGGAIAYVDLTAFVSLYARLHSAAELISAVLWYAGGIVLVALLERSGPRASKATLVLGGAATLWTLSFFGGGWLRAWHAAALQPTRLEPVYSGRMLARLAYVDAALAGEFGERAVTSRELDDLLDRYGIDRVSRHPKWDAPFDEPPALAEAVRQIRGPDRNLNIVVYYVDTLRADVAYDEGRMPNVARFAQRSIRFDSAYATGSDTLSSLPALIGGTYDVRRPLETSVLDTAREYGLAPTVFIPESAYEFLHKLMPSFEFDDAVRLSDYQKGGVWGYGADGPTAGPLVDAALSWMANRGDQRFFTWIFNFDVHNWRSLDATYLAFVAERHGMINQGDKRFDYDVSARGVDDAFGRLLEGIEQLGLKNRTMVLFVADHGEALGYQGFWVHSVFLWEPLVRVPLAISVPGLVPAAVQETVSLVDIAPTLERFITFDPTLRGYHGEDLMSYLIPERPPRRLPPLMVSTVNTNLARLGIMDGRWKLVLPTDWQSAELYDLEAAVPDEVDVADEHPAVVLRMMSDLVGSPIFTTAHEDLLEQAEE